MSKAEEFDPTVLTDAQLTDCIYEMRRRGAAVTVYDVGGIMDLTDSWVDQPTREQVEAWFDKDDFESAMSAAILDKVGDFVDDLQEDDA